MILLTGASGFVGTHLVRALSAAGKTVRALYNRHPPGAALTELPGISWMQADLLDIYDVEAALQGIRQVYHCAAMVSFDPRRHAAMLHTNVESTANLVDGCLEAGVEKLVHLSSIAALGRSATGPEAAVTEAEAWEEEGQSTVYGQSKYRAEMEVWRGAAEGLGVVIVNPGIILGEGDWQRGSARLMGIVDEEFPYYTGGITAWVDVQDVVRAMMLLMDSDVRDERFILNAGNYSYRDVFTSMAQALDRKPPHRAASPWMTGLIWRLNALQSRFTGSSPTITKETARNAQAIRRYNNEKLPLFLPGFRYTPIDETIARMAAAFRSSGAASSKNK